MRELRPRAVRLVASRIAEAQRQDVVQSTMMKIFARASEFTPGRPCLPWFYAVMANELRAVQRREARFVAEPEDLVDESKTADALLIDRELERALDIAIESLDDDSADAIRALLGHAPRPDVSAATFRKRVSRAYAKLRLLLGGHNAG